MTNKLYILFGFIIGIFNVLSQNQSSQDTLDTQKVSVIKPYTPTLSDAFKLKIMPQQPIHQTQKKPIDYQIFSVPVASTFSPAKSKFIGLPKRGTLKSFNNVAALSIGNYTNISANLFLNHDLDKTSRVGGHFGHFSSQGGIDEVVLDDSFSTNFATVFYQSNSQESNLNVKGDFKRFMSNWYGISQALPADMIQHSNVKQTLSIFEFSTQYELSNSWLADATLKLHTLKDRFDSSEFNLVYDMDLKFDFIDIPLDATLGINFLEGTFDREYTTSESIDYGNTIISFSPSYDFTLPNFKVSAGFRTYFLLANQTSKHKFYIVPDLVAQYDVVESIFVAYAKIVGDVVQNTYLDLYEQNPFISPTLLLKPTINIFNSSMGVKGRLSREIGFDLKAKYFKQNDLLMFQKNTEPLIFSGLGYSYGNSFDTIYDDVDTYSFSGSIEGYLNDAFHFNTQITFNSFKTKSEEQVWNLPELEAEISVDWSPNSKLDLGLQLFYVGERFDIERFQSTTLNTDLDRIVEVEDFIDLNISAAYNVTERWLAQIKLNNILGQNYQRWLQYPTQGFQITAGAFYKFDF